MTEKDWFERVPKVELHLHLEGAIPVETTWELICKYGGDPSVPDIESLRRRFTYRDFSHFIDTWIWRNQYLCEYEDFTLVAEAVARDLAAQNIRYVEAFYSPPDFASHGLTTQGLTRAIRAGFARVPEVEIALVADLVRDTGPEWAARTLAEVAEVRHLGVVGIGIGGSEAEFPPGDFKDVYGQARKLGFHTGAHAGEAAGARSIWGALQGLQVERIGHATRAFEDPRLLDYLVAQAIPLEMCPLSNVCTGVVKSIDAHPIRAYFERGMVVTVNTDDPKMFGNSLAGEYRLLEEHLGFSRADIRALILNGVRSSWLPVERRAQLAAAFCADPAWND